MFNLLVLAQKVLPTVDTEQGGVTSLKITGDTTEMNWLMATDGSQYKWIDSRYQWGLGTVNVNGVNFGWGKADGEASFGCSKFTVVPGKLSLTIDRRMDSDDMVESYTFANVSGDTLSLSEIQVYTPWNDNYPDASTCADFRCHAHVWAMGQHGYTYALRMGNYAPHLGMMMTRGELDGYSISERGSKKGGSNSRGVIGMMVASSKLAPGEKYTFEWRVFPHEGENDFFSGMLRRGGVVASADKYVGSIGDKAVVTVRTPKGVLTEEYRFSRHGEDRYSVGGAVLEFYGVSSPDSIVKRRARFLVERQQYDNESDSLHHGAFLPYDNEGDSVYCLWKELSHHRSDLSDGRERLGIGIFLAHYAEELPEGVEREKITAALEKYYGFVRNQLQDQNYKTYSEGGRKGKNRIYNYPWVAHFYVDLYRLTGNARYLLDAYHTMMACYREGGYDFYAIDVPVTESIEALRGAGYDMEAEKLLEEYCKVADVYAARGKNFPKSEVNYEQSIVAPAVVFLAEVYLLTGNQTYIDAVEELMPMLEAFGGKQPSAYLHDIALRHWDGYWFGKWRQWGDTMPHYWSCVSADAFARYAEICRRRGDEDKAEEYLERARTITLGNLPLFTEDGRGSAAFLYPKLMDGNSRHCPDPLANDESFALYYYLKFKKNS
ncbi:MAG: hypothetical protein HFJ95_07825 [Muribaculaceae bacterium]|nr:hypothetical protein [Muribaculaceae bacterium]